MTSIFVIAIGFGTFIIGAWMLFTYWIGGVLRRAGRRYPKG